jgi:hypothetical protein
MRNTMVGVLLIVMLGVAIAIMDEEENDEVEGNRKKWSK